MPAVSKEDAEFLTNQKNLEQSGKEKGSAVQPPYYPAERIHRKGGDKNVGADKGMDNGTSGHDFTDGS